jgi:crossover junction endodeoxyribonuclease RuvC
MEILETTKTVLCLDLGIKTGYCIGYDDGTILEFGTINFAKSNPDKESVPSRLHNFVKEKIETFFVDHVYYEELNFSTTTYATQAHGAYAAMVIFACQVFKVSYTGVGVKVIKKALTNDGNANKMAMMHYAKDFCEKRFKAFSLKIHDDNTADAIGIFAYASGAGFKFIPKKVKKR